MKRRSIFAATMVSAVFVISACSSGGSSSPASTAGSGKFNAGTTGVVNPSSAKGGTLTLGLSSTPDSFDPGNTYYAWVLDFDNLFSMPMFTYKSCPGTCGAQVVPDLATDMGTVSDNGLTWTFHIQPNVKYEDGTVVTTQDVKYAIERTYDRSVMANGPTYYQVLLADPKYPGPYKDRAKNLMGLTSVQTPNATTIVFHLLAPFPDLPYVLAFPNSAPVPAAKDTGTNYQLHPMSTGPFKFQSYQLNKQLTLVPNTQWSPATDPNAKQLPSKIVVNLNMNQADLDNRLLAGDIAVDAQGTGVAAAAQARILASPTLKANADSAFTGRAWFAYLNTKVAPMNNPHCREAVEYAVNKVNVQTAWGGPVAGGAIASTLMVPIIAGYKSFDLYNALSKPTGDITSAKQQLTLCGQPKGFSTNLSYRSDRPKETAAATAIQASLAQVGIKVTLKGFPSGSYYTNFAGAPAYVHSHDLGIAMGGWSADWPNGFGFLDELVAGNTIVSTGNTNIAELNDPVINNLFTKSNTLTGAARTATWSQVDRQTMKDAAVLPMVYAKSLDYRSPHLTNAYIWDQFGMYNYAVLGVKS
ncbi:MAG: peptide/nickel transport system substrate-binding protein [Streptosporangiaceae bacterium]|jgi:peptide/nickel transport system substrate-binding protein|nr:peptide/nickel transport system substrate-binding protein [Streptosporangiaceae bacterium]